MGLWELRILAPVILGIGIACGWWLLRRRREPVLLGAVAGFTVVAGLVGVLVEIGLRVIGGPIPMGLAMPRWASVVYMDFRFIVPLLAGVLGLVLLALPARGPQRTGVADLTPRGVLSFASRRWVTAVALVTVFIVVLTVAAGSLSEPNAETGRYTEYVIELGGGASAGTTIYGWYFSVPALVLIGVLLGLALVNMLLIARPPISSDRETETQYRTLSTRNVLTVTAGSLVLHLAVVLESLAGVASLEGSILTDLGRHHFWTPMAALVPWFGAAAFVCAALGVALWLRVSLSGIPSRTDVSASSPS